MPRPLGACTNCPPPTAIPTCDTSRALILKNTRSPGSSRSGINVATGSELLGDTPRQRDAVPREAVCTRPLQSNPGRVGNGRPIPGALKTQRVVDHCLPGGWTPWGRGLATASRNRERSRHRARAGATGQQPRRARSTRPTPPIRVHARSPYADRRFLVVDRWEKGEVNTMLVNYWPLDMIGRSSPIYCGMEQTLLLNATYEPLKVVHWQKAITLWCQGKVEVIAVYDREIRAVSVSFKLPVRHPSASVSSSIKSRFDYVPFSRANIYARDQHTCRYCGHAVPHERADVRSRGAGRAWRPQGLGEHRHVLRRLQPKKGRTHAGRSGHAPDPPRRAVPTSAPADPDHDRPPQRAGKLARLSATGMSNWTTASGRVSLKPCKFRSPSSKADTGRAESSRETGVMTLSPAVTSGSMTRT